MPEYCEWLREPLRKRRKYRVHDRHLSWNQDISKDWMVLISVNPLPNEFEGNIKSIKSWLLSEVLLFYK